MSSEREEGERRFVRSFVAEARASGLELETDRTELGMAQLRPSNNFFCAENILYHLAVSTTAYTRHPIPRVRPSTPAKSSLRSDASLVVVAEVPTRFYGVPTARSGHRRHGSISSE